jgi:hypothetical protein
MRAENIPFEPDTGNADVGNLEIPILKTAQKIKRGALNDGLRSYPHYLMPVMRPKGGMVNNKENLPQFSECLTY